MVRTNEVPGVSGVRSADFGAAMSAAVKQRVNLTAALANHDDGSMSHIPGHEVAGIGYLGFVRQKNPRSTKNSLYFQPAHIVADEDVPAHQSALDVHPIRVRRGLGLSSHKRTVVKYHLLFNLVELQIHGKPPAPLLLALEGR